MNLNKIKAEKIKRPIQLLAVWLIASVVLIGSSIAVAPKITNPEWLSFALVISAVIVVIVLAVLVFMLLTRYRDVIMSDESIIKLRQQEMKASVSKDYEERFQAQQPRISEITPEKNILAEVKFGKAKLDILNDNIVNSPTDVLVSSDDNHLQARGGVAKAILSAAGDFVVEELNRRRVHKMRQGNIAITCGGKLKCRAIIHPAVIDLDENRYPDEATIRNVVRASVNCSISMGARSIALPVIGGGTASKSLSPSESVQAIISEIVEILTSQAKQMSCCLRYVGLYIFDKAAVDDVDFSKLFGQTDNDVNDIQ